MITVSICMRMNQVVRTRLECSRMLAWIVHFHFLRVSLCLTCYSVLIGRVHLKNAHQSMLDVCNTVNALVRIRGHSVNSLYLNCCCCLTNVYISYEYPFLMRYYVDLICLQTPQKAILLSLSTGSPTGRLRRSTELIPPILASHEVVWREKVIEIRLGLVFVWLFCTIAERQCSPGLHFEL